MAFELRWTSYHVIATRLPCDCHLIAIRLPPDCHPIATRVPSDCHLSAIRLPSGPAAGSEFERGPGGTVQLTMLWDATTGDLSRPHNLNLNLSISHDLT